MIKITDNHAQRLAKMQPARVFSALGDQLDKGAQSLVEHARYAINDGAVSGPGHVSGPVGGYPNSDTHELEESLHKGELIETPGEVRTSAIADAPYAAYVELGTSRMGARPYMQLATEEVRGPVVDSLGKRFIDEVNR